MGKAILVYDLLPRSLFSLFSHRPRPPRRFFFLIVRYEHLFLVLFLLVHDLLHDYALLIVIVINYN